MESRKPSGLSDALETMCKIAVGATAIAGIGFMAKMVVDNMFGEDRNKTLQIEIKEMVKGIVSAFIEEYEEKAGRLNDVIEEKNDMIATLEAKVRNKDNLIMELEKQNQKLQEKKDKPKKK